MFLDRLKVMPLLIVVAMMAFSVRFVEVVGGVSSIASGSALAEDVQKPDEAALEKPKADGVKAPAEKTAKAEVDATAASEKKDADPAKPAVKKDKTDEIIWKDAADSDIDASQSVKMEMFEDLSKRREAIDKREKDLMTREALLKATEHELDRKYQELETIRSEIKNLLVEQSEEEKKRIASLVKIYEGMKAKQAASIFNTLDLDVLVDVMTQMSERKVSPILAEMDPERARTITIIMAEQKKLPELPASN